MSDQTNEITAEGMRVCPHCSKQHIPTGYLARRKRRVCATCLSQQTKEWRHKNSDRVRSSNQKQYVKWRAEKPDLLRRMRAESQKKQSAKPDFRKKSRARHAVEGELRAGRMSKPDTCSGCGASGRIEAHHEDYDNPLLVVWLCVRYHNLRHPKRKAAIAAASELEGAK